MRDAQREACLRVLRRVVMSEGMELRQAYALRPPHPEALLLAVEGLARLACVNSLEACGTAPTPWGRCIYCDARAALGAP